jgi:DNA-binding CsgD family transcriptional regulator
VNARTHLRLALEIFEDLHAEPLAARATAELRASGETARKRDPSTLTKLTPTELQIAQLVSQGMSNKDVAAKCWVSPRTVEFHLRNCFTKTGVTSRGELAGLELAKPPPNDHPGVPRPRRVTDQPTAVTSNLSPPKD